MKNCLLFLIALVFFSPSSAAAQQSKSFTIKGRLLGESHYSIISATGFNERKNADLSNGEFTFHFNNIKNGEHIYLKIDSLDNSIRIITENGATLEMEIDPKNWPNYTSKGTKSQDDYIDFTQKIQDPFTKALNDFKAAKKSTDSKDSLRIRIANVEYQKAAITYQKETLIWIIRHADSYFTPDLILRWWPKDEYRAAYGNLTPKVKESFFGKRLKEKITTTVK